MLSRSVIICLRVEMAVRIGPMKRQGQPSWELINLITVQRGKVTIESDDYDYSNGQRALRHCGVMG